MKKPKEETRVVSDRALEFIMRDVFDSMMELTLESAYQQAEQEFDSIELNPAPKQTISQPRTDRAANDRDAEIIRFPTSKRSSG